MVLIVPSSAGTRNGLSDVLPDLLGKIGVSSEPGIQLGATRELLKVPSRWRDTSRGSRRGVHPTASYFEPFIPVGADKTVVVQVRVIAINAVDLGGLPGAQALLAV